MSGGPIAPKCNGGIGNYFMNRNYEIIKMRKKNKKHIRHKDNTKQQ